MPTYDAEIAALRKDAEREKWEAVKRDLFDDL